jgi:hypothetical protein
MGDDVPEALDRAAVRRILSERNMRTPSVVIGGEFRKDPSQVLSLSQTSSGWQLIENQAILSWDEGSLQTYWLDDRRSAPVAGNARGRDLDVAAANKRPAAGCSKETLLQYHRPIDIRWSLSVVP